MSVGTESPSQSVQVAIVKGGSRVDVAIPDELSSLEDGQEPQAGCSIFTILNEKDGDKRVVWNRMNLPEIRSAKKMFDDLVVKGQVPHCVGAGGKATADIMSEFDPTAEEVIFMPMPIVVGG